MYPFSYRVSLRVHHPSIDPSVISETLNLKPKTTRRRGDPRIAVTGTALGGTWQQSYWTHRYETPDNGQPAGFIYSAALTLRPHREFFHQLRADGGDIEFFVGLFSTRNFGETFSHELFCLLGDLKIDVGFDIYPDRDS